MTNESETIKAEEVLKNQNWVDDVPFETMYQKTTETILKAMQEYSDLQVMDMIHDVIETIQDFETGLLDEDYQGKTLVDILKMKFR